MSQVHITANSRLTQFLKQQLTQFQHGVGLTPHVQTWAQWWDAWQTHALLMGELSAEAFPDYFLTTFESQLLWSQLLDQAVDKQPDLALLNPRATAKQCHQAWVFFQEYLTDDALNAGFISAETRLWLTLKNHYQQHLTQHNLSDAALWQQQQLAWLADGLGAIETQYFLHGFDDMSPNLKRWIDIVEARGAKVTWVKPETRYHESAWVTAATSKQEAQLAARWAVQQWQTLAQQKPLADIRIGLVAPNLQDAVFDLTWALDEQLVLAGLAAAPVEHRPYNVSLGQPMTEVPLVQNALLSLAIFLSPQRACRYADWSAWLLSPYTHGEVTARHALDVQLRKRQWANFTWPTLLKQDDTAFAALPKLKQVLRQWLNQTEKLPTSMTLVTFIQQAKSCLSTLKWARRNATGSLSSVEFQQQEAFFEALEQVALLKTPQTKQSASAWLGLLTDYLSEQIHQPQSQQVQPIQVLGMLEAGGQHFDGLWVMGLTDQAWPRMPQPNAFIPFELQRQVRLPRCDALRELDYATALTQRFAQAAPILVWSYAQHQDDAVLLPSPLLKSEIMYPQQTQARLVALPLCEDYEGLAEQAWQVRLPMEWVEDAQAPEVPKGEKSPGGTGILAAQNACPLMAFMDYRLGARQGLETVEEGMQSTQLGSLVHAVLEHFWVEVKTQSQLLGLSDEAIHTQLSGLIDAQMQMLASKFDAHYLALEKQRILSLLLEWLALEKQRLPFKVLANELETEISLADIRFKIKVDRIDEVDGDWIILDYKTGKASVKGLFSETFDAPQLAIYLFALQALAEHYPVASSGQVAGLGYGILHSDDGVKFNVLVDDDQRLTEGRTKGFSTEMFEKHVAKEGSEFEGWSWENFCDYLKDEVEKLALSVQQGNAQMVYRKAADLQYAGSWLALRLPEVNAQLGRVGDSEMDMESGVNLDD